MKQYQLLGLREYEKADGQKDTMWTDIGVAFPNKDGSFNLKFNYFPMQTGIKIQLREYKPKEVNCP